MKDNRVKIWEERVSIPTYETGKPNKNPMFLEKRVYQGSSGVVYPHQVIDKIHDEKVDKEYEAVFLENEYLKIMVMPSLGGRVQMAYDKKNDYHFVYYNQVIKPALVGLTGPWISGGIEFNWPQHHRPSTFEPVDYTIEKCDDGSMTLWVSEVELMTRTKGMAGFTLHPDKAYLEIKGKLYNRTDLPRTFLWWANPALVVNDDYQSVFPPDVNAVMDHGKRDVSRFPIAMGTYYKMDYSAGVDISRYKNIKVPTSYMCHKSDYNFIGGYDHGRKAGMLHVADRHVSPGKKQWVWGSGDFGQAWDRNLTDEDGPYAELMTGMFTDNQPDFSWLSPYEEKTFTQYFMPYYSIGAVKNADKNGAINLEVEEGVIRLGVYAAVKQEALKVVLLKSGELLYEKALPLAPGESWEHSLPLPEGVEAYELKILLYSGSDLLLGYSPEAPGIKPLPDPAEAALSPSEIKSIEELYLTGLHIEQYRHATRRAEDYYKEALSRDEDDIRNNNAMGRLLLGRCLYEEAELHFRRAIKRMTYRNPNPYDGEPYFNLGLALYHQDRLDEAYAAFYKSVWNSAFKSAGFYQLGLITCLKGEFVTASEHLKLSLQGNYHNHKARNLLSSVYRKLGRTDKVRALTELTRSIDPGDWASLYELMEISGDDPVKANDYRRRFIALMRTGDNNYLELSQDYAAAGFYQDSLKILDTLLTLKPAKTCSPLISYHRAWLLERMKSDKAPAAWKTAAEISPDGCFPSKNESMRILKDCVAVNQEDSRAYYYLGNYNYGLRNYDEAIAQWKKSIEIDDSFPTVHRNLALALMNKCNDSEACGHHLGRAFELDPSDARVLYELDQFYKKMNHPLDERLSFLNRNKPAVQERDDLCLEYISLLNGTGAYETAWQMISSRQFHPWEGGEGKVPAQYKMTLMGLAVKEMNRGAFEKALELLERCRAYPHNLGEGKLYGTLENDLDYLSGIICRKAGKEEEAAAFFLAASRGPSEPVSAMYYNDQPPHMIFFQGLALKALGKGEDAASRFNKLLDYGQKHIEDDLVIDYFAVSLPDFLVFDMDINEKNRIHCLFMLCLGYAGTEQAEFSQKYLQEILEAENHHMAGFLSREIL
ncbi:MAG: DUF5107 domain-containing protein [Spirochaetales bacterium]|nr:DUF5107 domain-containing protein [Spirochaetales bacterium]